MFASSRSIALSARGSRTVERPPGQWLQALLLGAVAALCVSRTLVTSEGASWLGTGQPLAMLWLLVATLLLVVANREGRLPARLVLTDALVAVLIAVCALSAVINVEHAPRLSRNMLWEWIALGVSYFLVRQLVRPPTAQRALVVTMIAVGVVLCAHGLYQVFVSLPSDRAAYEASPDLALRRAGHWLPPGSSERRHFEDRLYSTEPLATFALTNSLAGYLAPWLIVAVAIALAPHGRTTPLGRTARWPGRALPWAVVLVLAGCLVLTKSRSAWIACGLGLALLYFGVGTGRRLIGWKFAAAAAVVLAFLVVGAVASGGLDLAVLSGAARSLQYRFEYWQATLSMIAEHPWWGVGPGNFQDFYTRYKLPQASEEVADPHNFLFEVWATAGTPAALALVAILASGVWEMFRSRTQRAAEEQPQAERGGSRSIFFGAAAGFVLAFVVSQLVDLTFSAELMGSGILLGGLVVLIYRRWVAHGELRPSLSAVAIAVLLVNLLAAGGIAFSSVAGSLWLLLALGLSAAEVERDAAGVPPSRAARLALALGLLVALAALAACYLTAYRPVLQSQMFLMRASRAQDGDQYQDALEQAAAADPIWSEPWQRLAQLHFDRWRVSPTVPRLNQLADAVDNMLAARPYSSALHEQAARWYAEVAETTNNPQHSQRAAELYQQAVELYPLSAPLRARAALALAAGGRQREASRQAAAAEQLDQATPHADRKIPPELRDPVHRLSTGAR